MTLTTLTTIQTAMQVLASRISYERSPEVISFYVAQMADTVSAALQVEIDAMAVAEATE